MKSVQVTLDVFSNIYFSMLEDVLFCNGSETVRS